MEYGVSMNFKKRGEKVIVLGQEYDYRKEPIFAIWDGDMRCSHLLTAGDIRKNWNSWTGELLAGRECITTDEATERGIEVL